MSVTYPPEMLPRADEAGAADVFTVTADELKAICIYSTTDEPLYLIRPLTKQCSWWIPGIMDFAS